MSRVVVWPDGSWCYDHELPEYGHKSDDYIVADWKPEGPDDEPDYDKLVWSRGYQLKD